MLFLFLHFDILNAPVLYVFDKCGNLVSASLKAPTIELS